MFKFLLYKISKKKNSKQNLKKKSFVKHFCIEKINLFKKLLYFSTNKTNKKKQQKKLVS